MRLNRSPFKPRAKGGYRIEGKADEATVFVYDEISWFGVSADKFVKDLNDIKASTIHLRINSPGGAVFDGLAIYNALKQHKAKVVTHIDGLAASTASIIALSGDEVRMSETAFMMIHNPWSIVIGMADDMRKEADLLDKVGATIASTYIAKTGKTEQEIQDYMEAETWFTAEEALAAGFIDAIDKDDSEAKNQTRNLFDLSVFANVPDTLKDNKQPPTATDLERILRDAGCSTKQAKVILSKGYVEAFRDAKPEHTAEEEHLADPQPRDVVAPVKPVTRDKVSTLLARAELFAPSL